MLSSNIFLILQIYSVLQYFPNSIVFRLIRDENKYPEWIPSYVLISFQTALRAYCLRIFILVYVHDSLVERLGAPAMTGQLRHLCDLLLADANACGAGGSVASQSQPQASPQSSFSRLIEALAELLFRRAIVPIDRFLLTLLLRNYEGSESSSTLSSVPLRLTHIPVLLLLDC